MNILSKLYKKVVEFFTEDLPPPLTPPAIVVPTVTVVEVPVKNNTPPTNVDKPKRPRRRKKKPVDVSKNGAWNEKL